MTKESQHLAECNQGEWGEWGDCCKFDDAIAVLRAIRDGAKRDRAGRKAGEYGNFVTDIAKKTGLSESHVELYQYIFCSAGWCDYGTSPRGCFPDHSIDFDELVRKWETYYRLRWGEEPGEPVAAAPIPVPPFGIFDFTKQAELAGDDFNITRMDNTEHLPIDFDGPIIGSICNRAGDIWIAANTYCECGVISVSPKQATLAAGFRWQRVGEDGDRVLIRRSERERCS